MTDIERLQLVLSIAIDRWKPVNLGHTAEGPLWLTLAESRKEYLVVVDLGKDDRVLVRGKDLVKVLAEAAELGLGVLK